MVVHFRQTDLEQLQRYLKLPGTKLTWERKAMAIFSDQEIAENALGSGLID